MVVRNLSDQTHHRAPKTPKEALEATLALIRFWGRKLSSGSRELLSDIFRAAVAVFEVVSNEIERAGSVTGAIITVG